ncbi:MAG: hypothetical protein UV78_C0005G0019 [Parcubacteria group bacterium GW2011_GWA2_43_17]|nr:MAG: hypothetical protein UV78_C0005G0019 [Parcubacteria group bacterium GW2011_GWA2_43_17]
MSSLYRNILKKSWQITKKHLYLWPLGFFVAFLGNGGEYQILTKQIGNVRNQPEAITNLQGWFNTVMPNLGLPFGRGLLLALFLIASLLIILLVIWLVISAVAGLIKGSVDASKDQRNSFAALLATGSKNFKPVFGLFIIAKIIVYTLLALILTPLMLATFAQGNVTLNILIIIISFLIFVPLTIIVSFVTRFAAAFVVLQGQKMTEAFKNGWRLFAANWLISLEMAFILLIINLVVGFALFIVAFLLFSPFFFIGMASAINQTASTLNIIMIPVILIILLTMVIGSMLATFQLSSWTLLYLRLTEGGKAHSKIVRWVAMLPEKMKRKKIAP